MSFEDFLRSHNIVLIFKDFTTAARGFVYFINDEFLIVLNRRYSSQSLKKAFVHEFIHIFKNHYIYDDIEKSENETKMLLNLFLDKFDYYFQ